MEQMKKKWVKKMQPRRALEIAVFGHLSGLSSRNRLVTELKSSVARAGEGDNISLSEEL